MLQEMSGFIFLKDTFLPVENISIGTYENTVKIISG